MQMIPRASAYCLLKRSIVTLDRLLSASAIYAEPLWRLKHWPLYLLRYKNPIRVFAWPRTFHTMVSFQIHCLYQQSQVVFTKEIVVPAALRYEHLEVSAWCRG